MVMVYLVGMGLWVAGFLGTLSYKKAIRKRLNKKRHRLWMLYGMAMFWTDRLPKRILHKNASVSNALKELSVKEEVKKETYLYFVEKMAISLLVLLGVLIVGLLVSLSEAQQEDGVTEIARDAFEEVTYTLGAKTEQGVQETLVVDVGRRERTPEEVETLFDAAEKLLEQEVLGENESADKVNTRLNLVSTIGEEEIDVTWEISDDSIVSYEGEISAKVPEDGGIVTLTATMRLEEDVREFQFPIHVYPNAAVGSLQSQVQSYVDAADPHQKTVALPEQIDGENVTFFQAQSTSGGWILGLGLFFAIAVFFLKDRELKKTVAQRNEQLLMDYAEIVSKLLLYYEAGLSMKSAFERIVAGYREEKKQDATMFRYAYEEMGLACTKMKSGVSQREAIHEYGARCGIHSYVKLAGMIEQNLKRGAREMSYALKTEVAQAMAERKHTALKAGSQLSTKLLGPMVLMLLISMAIIMFPALMSMKM